MKKVLLSLVVLATLVSCGKNNKVSSSTSATSITNPIVTNSSVAQTLVSQIDNPSAGFGNGVVNQNNNQQTCDTKWGIFYYCYTSSGSGTSTTWNTIVASKPGLIYQYSDYTTVIHSSVDVLAKQNELRSILNSATNVQATSASGGYVYYVTVGNGYYVIDTRYPIQANPSAYQVNGAQRYLIQAI